MNPVIKFCSCFVSFIIEASVPMIKRLCKCVGKRMKLQMPANPIFQSRNKSFVAERYFYIDGSRPEIVFQIQFRLISILKRITWIQCGVVMTQDDG